MIDVNRREHIRFKPNMKFIVSLDSMLGLLYDISLSEMGVTIECDKFQVNDKINTIVICDHYYIFDAVIVRADEKLGIVFDKEKNYDTIHKFFSDNLELLRVEAWNDKHTT